MKTDHILFRIALLVAGCMALETGAVAADAGPRVDFARQIKPLLAKRCINCHHTGALMGGFSLENQEHALKDRPGGKVIIPGHPFQSLLYLTLSFPKGDEKAMPPSGHRIPGEDKELIRRWIEQGAQWPRGADGVIQPPAAEKSKSAS